MIKNHLCHPRVFLRPKTNNSAYILSNYGMKYVVNVCKQGTYKFPSDPIFQDISNSSNNES